METERSGGIITYLKNKHALATLIYHLVTIPIIAYTVLSHQYSGGPCNPGLDLGAVLLGGLVDVIMLLVSLGFVLIKGKPYVGLLLTNLTALAILIIISLF